MASRFSWVALSAALLASNWSTPLLAQVDPKSGPNFEVNRSRVTMNFAGACSKSSTVIVPTVYLNVEARNSTSARKGNMAQGGLGLKARVFAEGMDKAWLQGMAKTIQDDLVAKLRAAGKTVLTFDDIRSEAASAPRMAPNPKYALPTHNTRFAKDIDFVSVAPSDEQAVDYGMLGAQKPWETIANAHGAVVIVPEIWLTMPQVGSEFSSRWDGVEGKITFDPQMRLFAANLYSGGKAGGCLVVVPEHGGRPAALVAGAMQKLGQDSADYGDYTRGTADFAFVVNRGAVETGALAVGRSFNDLVRDVVVTGKK